MNIELALYGIILLLVLVWIIKKVKIQHRATELVTAHPTQLHTNMNIAEALSAYLTVIPPPPIPEPIAEVEPIILDTAEEATADTVPTPQEVPAPEALPAKKEIFRRTAVSREDFRRERISLEDTPKTKNEPHTQTPDENLDNEPIETTPEQQGFVFNPQHAIIYQEIMKRRYE